MPEIQVCLETLLAHARCQVLRPFRSFRTISPNKSRVHDKVSLRNQDDYQLTDEPHKIAVVLHHVVNGDTRVEGLTHISEDPEVQARQRD